jgi:hypothetical protein
MFVLKDIAIVRNFDVMSAKVNAFENSSSIYYIKNGSLNCMILSL